LVKNESISRIVRDEHYNPASQSNPTIGMEIGGFTGTVVREIDDDPGGQLLYCRQ